MPTTLIKVPARFMPLRLRCGTACLRTSAQLIRWRYLRNL